MTPYIDLMISRLHAFFTSRIWIAVSISVALVVGPLLTFSEVTLKGILDSWLSQCVIVIDATQAGEEAPLVRLYMFGEMPESLPMTFSAKQGVIERISFLNYVEQETIPNSSNRLVHHLASQRCPGELCPESAEPSEKLTIRLASISPSYSYQFRVLMGKAAKVDDLKVYVLPRGDDKVNCRVEAASVSNYFARQSRGVQVFILFISVFLLTLFIGYLRTKKGDENAPA